MALNPFLRAQKAVLPCSPVWYMSTENHAVSLSSDVAELALQSLHMDKGAM